MNALDPRLNAFRPDLADARLRGAVEAARYVEPVAYRVVEAVAPLKRLPRQDASLDSEVLRGEVFHVLDEGEGWSWGQLASDSYVGYVPTAALGPLAPEPTHRISALRTFVYAGPDLKQPVRSTLSFASVVALAGETETRGTLYRHLAGGEGAVVAAHVQPLDASVAADFVAVAERFIETPYLWGGRSGLGLDCSALVQLSLMATGRTAPRDTDLQAQALGEPVGGGLAGERRRGDLVFWKGHVAILVDSDRIVHASGHHMAVVVEPLVEAVDRIARLYGMPTGLRRLS